jgi:hypothetical protein
MVSRLTTSTATAYLRTQQGYFIAPVSAASETGTRIHPANWWIRAYVRRPVFFGRQFFAMSKSTTGRKSSRLYQNREYGASSITLLLDFSILNVSLDGSTPRMTKLTDQSKGGSGNRPYPRNIACDLSSTIRIIAAIRRLKLSLLVFHNSNLRFSRMPEYVVFAWVRSPRLRRICSCVINADSDDLACCKNLLFRSPSVP